MWSPPIDQGLGAYRQPCTVACERPWCIDSPLLVVLAGSRDAMHVHMSRAEANLGRWYHGRKLNGVIGGI